MGDTELRVVCVGGGLTGLALCLACHRLGRRVDVFEQASEFREIGAGLSVQTNACRLINGFLGLEYAYAEIYNPSGETSVRYRHWRTGETLQDLPHSKQVRPQDVGRYVSRSDLLDIIRKAIPPHQLHTRKKLVSIDRTEAGGVYTIRFADGTSVEADIVAAADGIHSLSRRILADWKGSSAEADKAVYTGEAVWRCVISREMVPLEAQMLLTIDPGAFITRGDHRHIMTYPIGKGPKALNVVAYTPEEHDGSDSWTAKGDVAELKQHFAGWSSDTQAMIDGMLAVGPQCYKQALYYRALLENWTDGGLALLGDAAHAIPPYLGQGSASGIEDAVAFAILLQGVTQHSKRQRLEAYFALRKPRCDKLAKHTLIQGKINSAPNPEALKPEEKAHMASRSWLWDYKVDEEADAVLADLRRQGARLSESVTSVMMRRSARQAGLEPGAIAEGPPAPEIVKKPVWVPNGPCFITRLPREAIQTIIELALSEDPYQRQHERIFVYGQLCSAFSEAAKCIDADLMVLPGITAIRRMEAMLATDGSRFNTVRRLRISSFKRSSVKANKEKRETWNDIVALIARFKNLVELHIRCNGRVHNKYGQRLDFSDVLQKLTRLPCLVDLVAFGLDSDCHGVTTANAVQLLSRMPRLDRLTWATAQSWFASTTVSAARPFRLSYLEIGDAANHLLPWLTKAVPSADKADFSITFSGSWPWNYDLQPVQSASHLSAQYIQLGYSQPYWSGVVPMPLQAPGLRSMSATSGFSVMSVEMAKRWMDGCPQLQRLDLGDIAEQYPYRADVQAIRNATYRDNLISVAASFPANFTHLSLAAGELWTDAKVNELESACRARGVTVEWTL